MSLVQDMSLVQERCPGCAAPLPLIQPTDRRLKCSYCGSALRIERNGDGISVELADLVIGTIEQSGAQTQAEFRRLHLTQELSSAEMRLANVHSEMRSIQRGSMNGISRTHLNELHQESLALQKQIANIKAQLDPDAQPAPEMEASATNWRMSPQRLLWLFTSVDGRANRAEFWTGVVIALAFLLVTAILRAIFGGIARSVDNGTIVSVATGIGNLVTIVQFIILAWTGVVVGIKRFHDHDKPGWWVLVGFIPVIGAFWFLIELGLLQGTPGPNRYG